MEDKVYMPNEIKFALYSVKKNIQSSAELRTSFLMNVIGMAINNVAFILLWIYFIKSFGIIGGWTSAEVVALQGFLALSYGIVFCLAQGLRKIPDYVATGAFDRFMLSPKNLLLRVATSSFGASAMGDMVFGFTCLVIYGFLIQSSIIQILLMVLLIILSTLIFLATVIAIFSTSFLWVDSNAVTNGIFELFLTPALFHGGAFQGFMRFIFIFVIPSLLIGTIPVEIVRYLYFDKLALVALLAIFWLLISVKLFFRAVRRYESSNFMTFGN